MFSSDSGIHNDLILQLCTLVASFSSSADDRSLLSQRDVGLAVRTRRATKQGTAYRTLATDGAEVVRGLVQFAKEKLKS